MFIVFFNFINLSSQLLLHVNSMVFILSVWFPLFTVSSFLFFFTESAFSVVQFPVSCDSAAFQWNVQYRVQVFFLIFFCYSNLCNLKKNDSVKVTKFKQNRNYITHLVYQTRQRKKRRWHETFTMTESPNLQSKQATLSITGSWMYAEVICLHLPDHYELRHFHKRFRWSCIFSSLAMVHFSWF